MEENSLVICSSDLFQFLKTFPDQSTEMLSGAALAFLGSETRRKFKDVERHEIDDVAIVFHYKPLNINGSLIRQTIAICNTGSFNDEVFGMQCNDEEVFKKLINYPNQGIIALSRYMISLYPNRQFPAGEIKRYEIYNDRIIFYYDPEDRTVIIGDGTVTDFY